MEEIRIDLRESNPEREAEVSAVLKFVLKLIIQCR